MQEGFISIHFSIEQLVEMTENGVTIVAASGEEIAGVLFAQSSTYNMLHVPLAARMVKVLENLVIDGRSISIENSIVCGPVCVSKDYRGLGLLNQLYDCLKLEAKGRFQVGLTFVSQNNPRSLLAHKKVGMRLLTSFESEGRLFDAFAMRFE